ncbi:MAG TPA: cysteine-rich CWC family protein [Burkholderiaceae bacterium]|nr:cysteine-rich CWC family protein [Burkholderiaceae bacterium]
MTSNDSPHPPAPITPGAPDPARCPLCGQPNGCAMACDGKAQTPCWCTKAVFSAELLARVPEAARRKACICATCAAQGEG